MPDPQPSPSQGTTIGTFARVQDGGTLMADGMTVHLGPGAAVGKWFDVTGIGSYVSARNFKIDTLIGQPSQDIPVQLGLGVAGSLLAAAIIAFVPKVRRWLGSQIKRVLFWGVPPSQKVHRRSRISTRRA
jgi:hypothetical protein